MEELINFAKGPLFRFSFAVLILGLMRLVFLTVYNGFEAKRKAKDKAIPTAYVKKLTLGYVFPIRAFRKKPFYALISIIFHIGLLITPLFLFDHALLIDNSIGFSWIGLSLSKQIADILTITTVVSAAILLLMRLSNPYMRFLSGKQEYLWLILLIIPFVSGFICSQMSVSPKTYETAIFIHIVSGCLIFILIPFSKIAHCVLLPFGQWITARTWKFIPGAGEQITITLGKEDKAV